MPAKVLLVDDEVDFLEPIEFWLKKRGYDVLVAHNGEDALKVISENKPSIVFLDINMPVLNGPETLARIRESDQELPVIILTAYANKSDLKKCTDLKVSGFFPKHSEYTELLRVIETTLRKHKNLKD